MPSTDVDEELDDAEVPAEREMPEWAPSHGFGEGRAVLAPPLNIRMLMPKEPERKRALDGEGGGELKSVSESSLSDSMERGGGGCSALGGALRVRGLISEPRSGVIGCRLEQEVCTGVLGDLPSRGGEKRRKPLRRRGVSCSSCWSFGDVDRGDEERGDCDRERRRGVTTSRGELGDAVM